MVDMEDKNHELEIEAHFSEERKFVQSMAMHHSSELHERVADGISAVVKFQWQHIKCWNRIV